MAKEKVREERKAYAFKYLRADRQEVRQGPFFTKEEADAGRSMMKSAGAVVSDVFAIEVTGEQLEMLKSGKGGLADGRVKAFEAYLSKELEILDDETVGYLIVYKYLRELGIRVRRYVKYNFPSPKGLPSAELIKEFTRYRNEYREGVAGVLLEMSASYSPADGSVPEDIGEMLRKLSEEVARTR